MKHTSLENTTRNTDDTHSVRKTVAGTMLTVHVSLVIRCQLAVSEARILCISGSILPKFIHFDSPIRGEMTRSQPLGIERIWQVLGDTTLYTVMGEKSGQIVV